MYYTAHEIPYFGIIIMRLKNAMQYQCEQMARRINRVTHFQTNRNNFYHHYKTISCGSIGAVNPLGNDILFHLPATAG